MTNQGATVEHQVFLPVVNREVTHEPMPGYRYNSKLSYVKEEQQFYCRHKALLVGEVYNCYVKGCRRKLHFRNGKCFLAGYGLHDHPNQAEMYINLRALNEMKRILRSVENRLRPKQVFDRVMKRYPNSNLSFRKYENSLREHAKKGAQNEPEEAVPDTAEATLVNDTANRNEIDDIQDQNVTNATIYTDYIEPIEPATDDKSIELQDTSRTDVNRALAKTRRDPSATYTCVEIFDEPAAESTNIAINSTEASTTCVRIAKTANDLRNMQNSNEPNKSDQIRGEMDADSTLVSLQLTVKKNDKNWTLSSTPQQRANEKFIREIPATTNVRRAHLTTYDIIDQSYEPIDQSSLIAMNSTKASTTCVRIAKTANELRNMHSSKEANEPPAPERSIADSTLIPSDEQFMADVGDKNSTLRSPSQRTNKRSHHEISSTSKDKFLMMRISEADVNRLIKRGHVRFVQGQFQYHEPNLP